MSSSSKTTIALLILALCSLAYFFWPLERLKVSFQDHFCYLEDSTFILQWRHSVELQNWQEHYHLSSGRLFLNASYMQTFGAGTPSSGEAIQAPEGYIGLRSDVVLPSLHWIVSRNMQGKLITKNGIWKIYQIVPNYTEIEIKPSQAARIFFWLGNNCYDYGYFSSDYNK
ncbi:MAG: DUF1850 domain-containing protein [Alcaligenaceae bacterium]|jgi:hypothetical protein|nr:DUF1850 domain-containing protein [Alcaligenaceae bacterium]HZJ98314.1 DUF1850 domain-containing protein [Oligella sp.]